MSFRGAGRWIQCCDGAHNQRRDGNKNYVIPMHFCGEITALNIETLVPAIEQMLNIEFFPADVYVISDFPAEMHWDDVIFVTVASLVMSAIATLYPASRASKTHPAEALRYE